MTDATPEWLSEEEIRSAINDLSDVELRRLRGVAGALIYSDDLNWTIDDLLQEAVRRLLGGQRSWRSNMGLIPQLIGTMKSIASQQRTSLQHQSEVVEVDLPPTSSGERDERHMLDDATDPSFEAMELQYEAAVVGLFECLKEDPLARDILIGNMYGYKRAELIDNLKLTPKEFDTANTRLKRQIARYAENGEEIL